MILTLKKDPTYSNLKYDVTFFMPKIFKWFE